MRYLIQIAFIVFLPFAVKAQWQELSSGTTSNLTGIQFINASKGYCIGQGGVFLKTDNGGQSWTRKVFPVEDNFNKLQFINSDTGFICSDAHLYKTTDGGSHFSDLSYLLIHPDTPAKIPEHYNLSFKDGAGIITASWDGDTSISLITHNSGYSWQLINEPPNSAYGNIVYSIVDHNIIYAERVAKQYKSTDGGVTWNFIRNLAFSTIEDRGFVIFDENGKGYASCGYGTAFMCLFDDLADSSISSNSIVSPSSHCFLDTATGYILQENRLYITRNRGLSRQQIYDFPKRRMLSVHFTDSATGFVCGDSGVIYKLASGNAMGADDITLKNSINVYPNPASGKIYMSQGSGLLIENIRLSDASGRVIRRFGDNERGLSVAGIATGIYYLEFGIGGQKLTKRVVIQ